MAQRGIVEVVADSALAPEPAPARSGDTVAPESGAISRTSSRWSRPRRLPRPLRPVRERRFETFLLWGVTASGKTEVYLRLAAEALAAERRVLVLVPEIALADQVVRAFRARFGPLVGIAHSAQNVGRALGELDGCA